MKKAFNIFWIGLVAGLGFLLLWNLNHCFNWVENGDVLYGLGTALTLLSCSRYINVTTKRGWRKIITEVFFYITLSNFFDEIIFDPYKVCIWEWISALLTWIFIHFYHNYYNVDNNINGSNIRGNYRS